MVELTWIQTYMAGALNASKEIWVIFSLLAWGKERICDAGCYSVVQAIEAFSSRWQSPLASFRSSPYLGVKGGLRVESGVLLRGDAQLVVEGVMPDLLHVVPVCDDSVLDGVFQGKDT